MNLRKILMVGIGLGAALSCALAEPALAQTNQTVGLGSKRPINIRRVGYSEALVNSSVSSTTPVVVLTQTFTPINDPNAVNFPGYTLGGPYEHIRISWSADVTKATSTTGSCSVYVNGAVYAPSQRAIGYAGGEGVISGVLDVANTVTGAQSVQLQCSSADTATFTINRAVLAIDEAY